MRGKLTTIDNIWCVHVWLCVFGGSLVGWIACSLPFHTLEGNAGVKGVVWGAHYLGGCLRCSIARSFFYGFGCCAACGCGCVVMILWRVMLKRKRGRFGGLLEMFLRTPGDHWEGEAQRPLSAFCAINGTWAGCLVFQRCDARDSHRHILQ